MEETSLRRSVVRQEQVYRVALGVSDALVFLWLHLSDLAPLPKYLCVLIPFFLSLGGIGRGDLRTKLTIAGLGATLVADFFFVVLLPPRPVAAMSCFLVVQTLYRLRSNDREDIGAVARRIGVFHGGLLIACLFALAHRKEAILLLLAVGYAALLLSNVAISFGRKEGLSWRIGMILFLLCDLFIGVSVLLESPLFSPKESLAASLAAKRIAWVCYPLSQCLLALDAIEGARMRECAPERLFARA